MYFFDTNVLLENNKSLLNKQNFYISYRTLKQLENIKISAHKDEDIKYKARKAVRWLTENQDKYTVCFYNGEQKNLQPDMEIILTAKQIDNIVFITYDLSCYLLAKGNGLKAELKITNNINIYKGYSRVYCSTDQELADFYTKINSNQKTEFSKLNINEYLLLYDQDNNLIDKYKYLGKNQFSRITYNTLDSKMFGKVKPIDPYQELVIDSLKHNKLTLIKGAAGTGKSLLSVAYLFEALQKGKIDKIIIFCNTVATAGSAKLGYYPGSRTQKLLDSQIGNFLISKLGARQAVDRLIEEEQLILLPMSDIRGYDTSGMKAGIYITQAQNLNIELLKLALQRIGEDSICILDGDNTNQVDLGIYAGNNNGLKRASQVFRNQDFYGEITLQQIHRSKIANIANKM